MPIDVFSQPELLKQPGLKLNAIINNQQSMTNTLKDLDANFSVNIIYNAELNQHYMRIVALELKKTPVLMAVSITNSNNKIFYDILANSQDSSIGYKLFAPDSKIKREHNMNINYVYISQIDSQPLYNYLLQMGYIKNTILIERKSIFYYQQESMALSEFILPGLINFL